MGKLRIAFFSPFNPQKSGVSDYSEELLPYLAGHADVELVADGYTLTNAAIARRFPVRSVEQFLRDPERYDGAIYQLANNYVQHAYMLPCLQRIPGVCVFHDYHLHYLMLGATLQQGDRLALERVLSAAYNGRARALSWRLLFSLQDPYSVSMVGPLIDMSRSIVTHSEYARNLILKEKPGSPVRVIPMGMPAIDLAESRGAIRRKFGFSGDEFILASVSTLSYTKRIEVALEALRLLKPAYPRLRFLILGGGRLGERARKLIGSYGLGDIVRITGWADSATYSEYLVAADAVIDLRYPSGAETSASLLRALSAGKPAIVSAQGSFMELSGEFALKIPVGGPEAALVQAAVARMMDDPQSLARMSEASMRYARGHLRLDAAAAAYIDTVRQSLEKAAPASAPVPAGVPSDTLSRKASSLTYKLFRLGHLYRNYGLHDTLRRVRSELRSNGLNARVGAGA